MDIQFFFLYNINFSNYYNKLDTNYNRLIIFKKINIFI